jgi:hypothetical protein
MRQAKTVAKVVTFTGGSYIGLHMLFHYHACLAACPGARVCSSGTMPSHALHPDHELCRIF